MERINFYSADKVKKFYREFNREKYKDQRIFTPADKVRVDILRRMVSSQGRILDIGCFDGTIAGLLMSNGNNVFGIDISEDALRIAQKRGVVSINSDINDCLPFKEDSFDSILIAELIEHVLDLNYFMQEVKRVLKKDGTLVLSTPNLASLGRRLYLLFGKSPSIEIGTENAAVGHIRYFVRQTLFSLLRQYNFEIIEFCSDVVNLDNSGNNFSVLVAKIIPGFGRSIIIKAISK